MDSEVRAAYERLVDGGRWFGSLDAYRTAWERWANEQDPAPVPASVETRILDLQILGEAAVLTHSIQSRERINDDEADHEIETIVFARQPDGRCLIVHQHLGGTRLSSRDTLEA